jgi:hypothetical protein
MSVGFSYYTLLIPMAGLHLEENERNIYLFSLQYYMEVTI